MLAVLFCLFLIPAWGIAQTCDCLPVASARDALLTSTHVFVGTVLEKNRFSVRSVADDYKEFKVKMHVKRVWKGEIGKTITVRTPAQSESCGFDFRKGQSYLVYGIGDPMPIVTLCSRSASRESGRVASDKIQLGPGKLP
jgi:hypothetical protein